MVKVSYTPTSETPVATSVEASPKFGPDVRNVTGQVAEVSPSSITISTGPEQLTFPIPADASADFDVPHLEDHAAKQQAVRVYYRDEGGTDQAVGYEDA